MEIAVGQRVPELHVDVEPGAMKVMALLLRDPNPIHFDPAAVAHLGLGPRVLNQGPLSVGYVSDMLIAWTGDGRCIRQLRCRFLAQVLAGDRLTAGGEVGRVESHDGSDLVVELAVWVDNDQGTRVLEGTAVLGVSREQARRTIP